MSEMVVFSASGFQFCLGVETIEKITYHHEALSLENLQVQNLNTCFSHENQNDQACCRPVTCWIIKKSGDALGVDRVLGLRHLEIEPLPSFLEQNMKVGAIQGFAHFQSQLIFLFGT